MSSCSDGYTKKDPPECIVKREYDYNIEANECIEFGEYYLVTSVVSGYRFKAHKSRIIKNNISKESFMLLKPFGSFDSMGDGI